MGSRPVIVNLMVATSTMRQNVICLPFRVADETTTNVAATIGFFAEPPHDHERLGGGV